MRRSQMLLPLLKENPQEAQIISHQLMLRAGMINQTAAGIYSWLPLGQRVLAKVEKIIEEELDAIGCQRIIMPTIQPATLWQESGRYDAYGKEMLRIKDRHDRDMLYGPTAEEVVADIARQFTNSYKQLPFNLYQIGWKFRDEIRPRFGIMRGREFLMKDAYSFHLTTEDGAREYEAMYNAYTRIFERIFGNIPMKDDPTKTVKPIAVRADTGPIGGNLSHEFQIPASTGESAIFYDNQYMDETDRTYQNLKDLYTAADEMHDPKAIPAERLRTNRGIEVGHIFFLGDKYSKALNVQVTDHTGALVNPYMGCYGIGVTRIVGAAIEVSHDDYGIIWPDSIAPFQVGIINLLQDDPSTAEDLYHTLTQQGMEVLYDDRTQGSAGMKFSEMDLIGLPLQIIVGKGYLQDKKFEVKNRRTGMKRMCDRQELLAMLVQA